MKKDGINQNVETSLNELDSHADTCCFGENAYILSHDTSQHAWVSGFHPSFEAMPTAIVSVALAYDDPISYTTYILVFHQSLYFEQLQHNLICPAQLRMNDITVNDTPLSQLRLTQTIDKIDPASHSIISSVPPLQIPLQLRGIMSYFVTRTPTLNEIENPDLYPQITMTYESPTWEPYNEQFSNVEERLREQVGYFTDMHQQINGHDNSCVSLSLRLVSSAFDQDLCVLMERAVKICDINQRQTTRRKGTVTPEELSQRWHIGLDTAKKTIERTTQLGVRDFMYSKGTRRLRHAT
jgi:hypothetical protein